MSERDFRNMDDDDSRSCVVVDRICRAVGSLSHITQQQLSFSHSFISHSAVILQQLLWGFYFISIHREKTESLVKLERASSSTELHS